MKDYPIDKVYRLMEPGPVVLVTTRHPQTGLPNVMTMAFHSMVDHSGLLAVVISPGDYSYEALRETGECVIAIPGVDLIDTVVDIGNCTGEDIDKFKTFGLHRRKAKRVGAPLITECLANIECRVVDDTLADRYDLFVLEVVKAWEDADRPERRTFHHNGNGTFTVDGRLLNRQKKMVRWKQFQD